jgi:hypothetical protein
VVLKKLINDPFDAVVDALVASVLGSAGPASTDSGQPVDAGDA